VRSGDGRALRRSGFLDLDLKLICPNGSTSGRIFDDQTMLRTMQDLTRLRQRRNSFITVVLIITLIVIIRAGATVVNQGDTPTRSDKQFTGRDVYSPDVHPNPVGSGYIMWHAGWQTGTSDPSRGRPQLQEVEALPQHRSLLPKRSLPAGAVPSSAQRGQVRLGGAPEGRPVDGESRRPTSQALAASHGLDRSAPVPSVLGLVGCRARSSLDFGLPFQCLLGR